MSRPSPLHPRTSALCSSYLWKDWSGCAAVRSFDAHSEREYYAVRFAAGMIDVSPLYKYEVHGPDGGRLLARVFSRDVSGLSIGRVSYGCVLDPSGHVLDDGTIARLGPQHWRLTSSERWLSLLERHGRRLDAKVEDSTRTLAAIAVQGPASRKVCQQVVDLDLDRMRFFRVRAGELAGGPGWVSRTGYTGDLGYELWVPAERAVGLWDALVDAGAPHGLEPFGLDALDVLRIEAGFVLQGVDYTSSRAATIAARRSTPVEIGLGWTVDQERTVPSVAQAALAGAARASRDWGLVGVEIDVPSMEALYEGFGLPPHLAPCASRDAVPLYDARGRQVGYVTSHTWSPVLKKFIGLATLRDAFTAPGTALEVEHTVEYERRRLPCQVVAKPFFDPPRKRSTPGARRKRP